MLAICQSEISLNIESINCGVRLLTTNLTVNDVKPRLKEILESMFNNVPSGVGETGKIKLFPSQLDEVLAKGAAWAVNNGYGRKEDLEYMESNGCIKVADPSKVLPSAKKRGAPQLGTLGAGNHFLEIQTVNQIFLPEIAKTFGIEKQNQICIMIHTGSRGLGHQVCSDYIRILEEAFRSELSKLPDRELVYAPSGTQQCTDYFTAMSAAANYAWANRQMITHWVRQSFVKILNMKEEDIGLNLLYDVAHNIAKVEEHDINGRMTKLFVHRKGATRAFPPGHPELPQAHKQTGQCVIIPGSMGTASYVLAGKETGKETFFSTAHGAGRVSSRSQMLRGLRGEEVAKTLLEKGIISKAASWKCMAEEAPQAYKEIDEVVRVTEKAGISDRVVRLTPIAVMKG
ncbi:MAG: RtcB family protein [Candidatus Aenigmarchaeota archaeon]|nr:RtcB family protein [Candidatus Aenigmarchaeota archaeon]